MFNFNLYLGITWLELRNKYALGRRTGAERANVKRNTHKSPFLNEMIDERNIALKKISRNYHIKACS